MSNSNDPIAEQIDRVKLREALTNHFDLDELKSLCFELAIKFDELAGTTIETKAVALINYLGRRGRILELAKAAIEQRPDALLWTDITPQFPFLIQVTRSPISVEFVNRDYELNLICRPRSPRFILINGAPGIGKTYLLQQIKERYERLNPEPWTGALIDLGSQEAMTHHNLGKARACIADAIVEQFSSPPAFVFSQNTSEDEIVFQVVPFLLQQKGDILLLFDRVEQLAASTTAWLLHFVFKLDQGLKKGNRSLRIIFAGRYLANWRQPDQYALTNIALSTFTRETVRKVVEKTSAVRGRNATAEYISELTWHILQISGGHPLGIRNALEIVDELGFVLPSLDFLFYRHTFQYNGQTGRFFDICIEPIVNEILSNVDPLLEGVLYALSPMRRFDTDVLQRLQQQRLFQSSGYPAMWELLRTLYKTYLISPPTITNPMSSDQIVRRMLAMKMRLNEPERYRKINKCAHKIFHDRACGNVGVDVQLQCAAVLESLYHTLQLEAPDRTARVVCRKLREQLNEYLKIIPNPESRLRLKAAFEDDNELNDLIDQRAGHGASRGLLSLFHE